ncbi:MAG: sulfatase-like hydrolase/transferase [Flavobacteriales bacterium]|nr:sulfatase-like hydrolase/transferase [Flavobacteriales bacterium]
MLKFKSAVLFIFIALIGTAQPSERPNILFIICDDLNQLGLGTLADPTVHTPRIDELVSSSIAFTNAHANVSGCGPSRASMFSGVLPYASGHSGYKMSLNSWLDNPILSQTTSVFKQFLDNGYDVYGSGKVYHAFRMRVEDFTDYNFEPQQGPWAFDKGIHSDMPSSFEAYDLSFARLENVPSYPEYTGWQNKDGSPFFFENDENRDLMADELTVQYCRSLLQEYASGDQEKPFLLAAGIYNPHEPFHVPGKYWDLYDTANFDFGYLQPDTSVSTLTSVTNRFNSISNEAYGLMEEESPDDDPKNYLRQFIHGYYASVSFVDEQIGHLMDALEENNLAENTIVIYTSDHGFHLGSKNKVTKSTMWNDATAVPFVVKIPGEDPRLISEPISLIDLYPTLLEFGQIDEPTSHTLDGEPLQDVIFNNQKNSVLLLGASRELLEVGELSEVEHSHHGLIQGDYKYIHYSSGEDELYDLKNDFRETQNLSSEPDYLQLKNTMYRGIRNVVGFIRPPVPDYANLYYGDFTQDLNGWLPSEPNANFQLSLGGEIITNQHLIISSNTPQGITNDNTTFRHAGIHRFGFNGYSECSEGLIRVKLLSESFVYMDTVFTISNELSKYEISFMVGDNLPQFGDLALVVRSVSECDVHLDDFFLFEESLRQVSLLPCENAIPMQIDSPISQVEDRELLIFPDLPAVDCSLNGGNSRHLWQSFTPSDSLGILAAFLPEFNPVIEVFSDCSSLFEEGATNCSNLDQGGLEYIYLDQLNKGETYYSRVSTFKSFPVFGGDTPSIKSIFINTPRIEFEGENFEIIESTGSLLLNVQTIPEFPVAQLFFELENLATGETFQQEMPLKPSLSYELSLFPNLVAGVDYSICASYRPRFFDILIPYGVKKTFRVNDQIAQSQNLIIYPNPSPNGSNWVNIYFPEMRPNSSGTASIYDLSGRKLITESFESSNGIVRISEVNTLPKGTYLVKLSTSLLDQASAIFINE